MSQTPHVSLSGSRTRCLSTKLTEAEYAALERAAGAQTLSAWARAVLLEAAVPAPPNRSAGEREASRDRVDALLARPRDDDSRDDRLAPPTGDHIGPPAIAPAVAPVADWTPGEPSVVVDWRPCSTDGSSWGSARTAHAPPSSRAWFVAMFVLACLSTCGTGAYRYARRWTPLQRQYLALYVWSAVASGRGSYELLVIVDQTERRTALDADVVPGTPTPGGGAFGLSATAISRGVVRLTWERSEWDPAVLHAFLQHGVYQDQTLYDLARPALWWGVLAAILVAPVLAVADVIARGAGRRTLHSRWQRPACESNRAWRASLRPWFVAQPTDRAAKDRAEEGGSTC
jgi:hypothetical protein